jgi:hypothetical protein
MKSGKNILNHIKSNSIIKLEFKRTWQSSVATARSSGFTADWLTDSTVDLKSFSTVHLCIREFEVRIRPSADSLKCQLSNVPTLVRWDSVWQPWHARWWGDGERERERERDRETERKRERERERERERGRTVNT